MYRVRITTSAGGVVMRLPDTASDALVFLAWIYPRLTDSESEVDDMTEAIEHLCEWLGQHAVSTPATDAMQRADAALWFDEALDIGEKVTVALTLCRKASVPQRVIDELRIWMESATHKDCGCVRCADPEKYDSASDKTKAIVDEHCKRYTPSSQAINVASLSAAAKGSDLLGGPWAIYEARAAIEAGRNSGMMKRRREEEQRAKLRQKMAGKGVRRR